MSNDDNEPEQEAPDWEHVVPRAKGGNEFGVSEKQENDEVARKGGGEVGGEAGSKAGARSARLGPIHWINLLQ